MAKSIGGMWFIEAVRISESLLWEVPLYLSNKCTTYTVDLKHSLTCKCTSSWNLNAWEFYVNLCVQHLLF